MCGEAEFGKPLARQDIAFWRQYREEVPGVRGVRSKDAGARQLSSNQPEPLAIAHSELARGEAVYP
jgi:hypothetical protein